MTFNSNMALLEQPISAELYTFKFGDAVPVFYTSFFKNIVYAEETYQAILIQRSGFSISYDMSPATVSLKLQSSLALVSALMVDNGMKKLTLSIDRIFLDDETAQNRFKGEMVGGLSISAGECGIVFKDILYRLERNVCRVRVQSLCNNKLFDGVCGLDPTTYTFSSEVEVSSDGKTLTSEDFAIQADGYWSMGRCTFGGVTTLITGHVGNSITIAFPLPGLVSESTVEYLAGCDKHPQTCIDRFDNLDNFVGMPYVPLKDPEAVPLTNTGA